MNYSVTILVPHVEHRRQSDGSLYPTCPFSFYLPACFPIFPSTSPAIYLNFDSDSHTISFSRDKRCRLVHVRQKGLNKNTTARKAREGLNVLISIIHANSFPGISVCFQRYTRCPGGNVPDFGRMFLTLKYTDISEVERLRR